MKKESKLNHDQVFERLSLIEHREDRSQLDSSSAIKIIGHKRRHKISKAKGPMLDAIQSIIEERREFWPLTERSIHYALLNNPPLKHASRLESVYDNTGKSYKACTELCSRARLEGLIPWEAIGDATRPVTNWNVYPGTGPYIRDELDGLFKKYWRDLQASQPNHIEIVGEKNTVEPMLRPVALKYCLTLTIGRGYCSLPPRQEMASRFHKSGKDKLIVLFVSDFDPEGEDIAHSFARSMRDDFDIPGIVPIKVALTRDQIQDFALPPQMKAKKSSSRHNKFVEEHGDDVYELEALTPADLQDSLREKIESVLDLDAFDRELEAEREDAAHLASLRSRTIQAISESANDGD